MKTGPKLGIFFGNNTKNNDKEQIKTTSIINRQEEIKKILEKTKYKKSVLIIGKDGIGKTTLLKELKNHLPNTVLIRAGPPKFILEAICSYLGIEPKKRIVELFEICKQELKDKDLILLVDDIELLTKESGKILSGLPILLIGACRYKKHTIEFDETIKLKELSQKDNLLLAEITLKKEIPKVPLGLLKDIVSSANENPEKIVKFSNGIIAAHKNMEVDIGDRGSVLKLLKKLKPERKIIPEIHPWMLLVAASILLMFRYVFYHERMFDTGYLIAIVGYFAMAIYRIIKYRKFKK